MALAGVPQLLSALQQSLRPAVSLRIPTLWRISIPLLSSITAFTFPSNTFPAPSTLLRDIWEAVLRAVPKKKTTHSKKRHRQMAGKALKDVTEIVKCPGCGRPKRAHILCPYCFYAARMFWKSETRAAQNAAIKAKEERLIAEMRAKREHSAETQSKQHKAS